MKKIPSQLFLIGLLFIQLASPAQQKAVEAARSWIGKEGASILKEYAEVLSIPNHASDSINIRRNADLIQKLFSGRGFSMKQLTFPGSPPVVYGEKKVPGAQRTLCFYVHYDGQPADPSLWKHQPFEPVLYDKAMYQGGQKISFPQKGQAVDPNWRIYARSASDDKAPIMALLTAIDALKDSGIGYTSNIKLFFDGEEESSSPHVSSILRKYHELFDDISLWLLVDGPVFQTGDPTLKFGGRGVTSMELTVFGPSRPLHSGHYGNYAPVPGQLLAELLSSMKDRDGNVTIEGFYNSVEPISEFEKLQLSRVPDIDRKIREDLGIADPEGKDENLFQRLLLPSLTVQGLSSGNVGKQARNVIPATATANLGLRLVKGNDPEKMLDLVEAHIQKQGWHIVYEEPTEEIRMKYTRIVLVERDKDGFPASKIAMDHPAILPVIENVRAFTGEKLVLLPSEGGSNNIFTVIFDQLKKPGISVNIVNHDNNQHAENENVRIGNLWYGTELMAVLMSMPAEKNMVIKKR
ncbi:MAG: M20/M25/M40 family metallo-hydrolase [Bacteroidetes bacterium]|nr:M20/M25/M40 family metallo-hydrolase [Bacteroidota bacterium]